MKIKNIILCSIIIIIILQIININPKSVPNINIPNDAKYICFVDFGKLSCNDRLYIYDVKNKKYIYSARVQHGIGGNSTAIKPEFSNKIGSNCSSLGLYKVTTLSKMKSNKYVECLRLRGLSSTNSNAECRGILIHPGFSLSVIPKFPGLIIPLTPESKGCFTVSILTMKKLKKYFNQGNMYIYAYN